MSGRWNHKVQASAIGIRMTCYRLQAKGKERKSIYIAPF